MHAAGGVGRLLGLLQVRLLLLEVNLEDAFQQDDDENDAQHAERVGDGVGGCEAGRGRFRGGGRLAAGNHGVGKGLLGGTQAGGIGHGAGHHAHERSQAFAGNPVDANGHEHGEQDHPGGEQVHGHATLPEGMEEAGADLQADGEDEEDESEVLHERQRGRVGPEAEMADQDAQEEDPGGSDGDTFDLDLAEQQARGDDESE